ncbi:hypothetical protein PPYR_12254 [Photinus pyralis]|uniref:Uncharacterized protein n=1 Tax=Photinus pyralis TaxID=7054 RepID=A0A5N4ADL7_PHOPY|nr:hypothetical protein PPYR_12254 [Photinus pyralis]
MFIMVLYVTAHTYPDGTSPERTADRAYHNTQLRNFCRPVRADSVRTNVLQALYEAKNTREMIVLVILPTVSLVTLKLSDYPCGEMMCQPDFYYSPNPAIHYA